LQELTSKTINEGKIEVAGRRGRRCKQLLDDLKEMVPEMERGSTRLHSVEKLLWRRLKTCCKTGYGMNE